MDDERARVLDLQSKALEYRERRKAAGLSVVKTPFERHLERPDSRSLAIAAKCWDCQGRDYDPHVRWRIGNCEVGPVREVEVEQVGRVRNSSIGSVVGCPLYPVRPYQDLYQRPEPDDVA